MRAPAAARIIGSLWLALSCGALSCAYSPDFAGGQLQCGSKQSCPKGYSCASDNTCWKDGTAPTSPNDFNGTWTFTGGTLDVSCTDGSSDHRALKGDANNSADFIIVNQSGSSLSANYFCDWSLTLPSGGNTGTAPLGQSCTETTTDSTGTIMTTYTWSALAFTFTLDGSDSATSAGHVSGPFTDSTGVAGTCDVTFSGPLSKTGP
jgi:hypothetical protein